MIRTFRYKRVPHSLKDAKFYWDSETCRLVYQVNRPSSFVNGAQCSLSELKRCIIQADLEELVSYPSDLLVPEGL